MRAASTLLLLSFASIASSETLSSTAADREAVSVTVYTSDIALVRESRKINVPSGDSQIDVTGVPAQIIPESVQLRADGELSVREQRFVDDLQLPDRLLETYVGKTVKLVDRNPASGAEETTEATLLQIAPERIFEAGGNLLLGWNGRIVLPDAAARVTTPTLRWLVHGGRTAASKIEIAYLTNQMRWRADYTAVLVDDDTKAGLAAWATIENNTSAGFDGAGVTLVAGNVARQPAPAPPPVMYKRMEMAQAAVADSSFSEEAVFEYHQYRLGGTTNLPRGGSVQMPLFNPATIAVRKRLTFRGDMQYARGPAPESPPPQPAEITVEFKNDRKAGLGQSLPAGIVRAYTADADGALTFIGEDRIVHTPADETVRLNVGRAFDVVAERTQTSFTSTGRTSWDVEWRIAVRNHKPTPVEVSVLESFPGDWEIVSSTPTFTKEDARTARFDLTVPKDGESVITYKARVRLQ